MYIVVLFIVCIKCHVVTLLMNVGLLNQKVIDFMIVSYIEPRNLNTFIEI